MCGKCVDDSCGVTTIRSNTAGRSLQNGDRGRSNRRRWYFRLLILTVGLTGAELVFQAAALMSPRLRQATTPIHLQSHAVTDSTPQFLADDHVRHRGNPGHSVHDRLGFHNLRVPDEIDVVALGDSQTYGTAGRANEAWPAVVSRLRGVTVYNMGIPGWGPLDYLAMLDESLEHKPKIILVGVYLGNDLYDVVRTVSRTRSSSQVSIESWELEALFDQSTRLASPASASGADVLSEHLFLRCRTLISEHSRFYGSLRWTKECILELIAPDFLSRRNAAEQWRRQVDWTVRYPQAGCVFEHRGMRTILTPARRNIALNLSDARIADALDILKSILIQFNTRCRESGTRLAVVLIPTKESVFYAFAEGQYLDEGVARLVSNESVVRSRITAFLVGNDIPFVDVRAALLSCMESGVSPYPITRDGHPNVIGHAAIAESVATLLSDR